MGISHELSEEDVKFRYINEAITSKGWTKDSIFMEQQVKFTDGKISLHGNIVHREKPKFADYVLYVNKATPIAIIEAKDAKHTVSYGLQQAMEYAKMLDVKFAFSSNGEGFAEHDFLTGQERCFGMDEFPTREELIERYKKEINEGNGLNEQEEAVINQPLCSGQNIFPPRYYQLNAINRTINAIAKGQNRILLVMATGTGKTYTAFQIVWRLLKSGLKKKVLYLADRNILVDQSIEQDFKPLEKVIHKIDYSKDKDKLKELLSHQVYFALYQQLIGQNDAKNYRELFPNPDYFDLVIIDECHRGSAKDDSNWRTILDYFSSASHIGMTATPKETRYQSSIGYFGEPVYTYSLKNGIEDGFLAPFKVINISTNIGDEWRPIKGQKDIYGNEIEDRIYNNSDYDYNIVIEDWDGPIEIDPDYPPKPCSVCGKNPCVCPKPTPPSVCPVCGKNPCECPTPVPRPKPIVDKNGCEVKVINKVVSVYDTNGKLLRTESITDYTKKNIIDTYATIETFTSKWNALKRKSEIAEMLKEAGIDLAVLKHDRNMDDVDDFDFICHIAYGKKTLTRRERAEQVKKRVNMESKPDSCLKLCLTNIWTRVFLNWRIFRF